ncbi:L,D-transpeptidase family protein [Aestuariimicrobium ganziense]|uniref:L,D-transpeptidase family protein n=1 Tax=Aestuariimicrobium ganziense TaxID=2773677 RepID=UPI0019413F8E|nr:L,D-transpeptidase family protein [Aestuariimicrobium ganziense]
MRQVLTRLKAALAIAAAATLLSGFLAAPAQAAVPNRGGITSTVVARPGSTGSVVKTIQQNLIVLSHLASGNDTGTYGSATTTAVKAFQSANKLPVTGIITTRDNYFLRTKADAKRKTYTLDARCYQGRMLCINRTTKKMYWMNNGTIVKQYDVRTGRRGYETRLGDFRVYHKNVNEWSYLYNVRMPYSMYFDGGIAVHYSADFAANGYQLGSHGCVNMNSLSDASWLYSQVPIGTRVVVYK